MNSTKKMYDNYMMFHPNGKLMCYCDEKKVKWYVKTGLGYLDGNSLHLTFEPNGEGEPDELIITKKNICVISGLTDNLSKHHIVPYCYRRFFKKEFKSRNSLDVVALERIVHNDYEAEADKLKLLLDTLIPTNYKDMLTALVRCRSFIKTIEPNVRKIDPKIYILKQVQFENYVEKYKFTREYILNFKNLEHNKFKDIVDLFGEEQLTVIWKLHFMKYGVPIHLHENWHPFQIKKTKNQSEIYYYKGNDEFIKLLEKLDLKDIYEIYIQKIEL